MGRNSLHPLQYTTTSHLLVKQAAQQIFTTVVMPTHQAHGMALELCGCRWNIAKKLLSSWRLLATKRDLGPLFEVSGKCPSVHVVGHLSSSTVYSSCQKQHCCERLEELGVAVSSSRATWAGRSGARGTRGRGTSGHGKGRQSIKNKLIHGKP